MFHLWASLWHRNVIFSFTHTNTQAPTQVVICSLLTRPSLLSFSIFFPSVMYYSLCLKLSMSLISATLAVTFGWFVAFRLLDALCFFRKQRPVLSQLRASSLLCLFQLLICLHLCLQFTVKDEIWGLSVEKVRDKDEVSAGDRRCLGYLVGNGGFPAKPAQSPYNYHFKTENILWDSCWFRVCGLHYVRGGLFTSSVYRSILIKCTRTHKTHSVLISCREMLSAPTHFQTLV